MRGAGMYIKENLKISDVLLEIMSSMINVCALVGSPMAGKTLDLVGRLNTMVIAAGIFFAGTFFMGFATNYGLLVLGQFVDGVGFALIIASVYTAEKAPSSSRGFLTSFPEVFVNLGLLLGYISNVVFSKLPLHLEWRFMLGIGAIPSVFLAIIVMIMPKSPRWLVRQGKLGEAKVVHRKTSDSSEEAKERLEGIKEAAGIAPECDNDINVQVNVPKWAIVVCVAKVLIYAGLFSIGSEPIVWVYGTEIWPLRLRAQGTSLAVGMNQFMCGLVGMTFLSLVHAVTTAGAFFLFAGFTMISVMLYYLILPETMGRTLELPESLFGSYTGWRTTVKELETKKAEKAKQV